MPKIIGKPNRQIIKSLSDLKTTLPRTVEPVATQVSPAPSGNVDALIESLNEVATRTVEAVIEPDAPEPVGEREPEWRPKPAGGYRINNKFVSALAWNEWMDQQEAVQALEGAADELEAEGIIDADDEVDSREAAAHSDDEAADMEASEVEDEVGVIEGEVIEDTVAERTELLDQLLQYVTTCGYSQDMLNRAKQMNLPELREFVESTRINSGGSITVAELLAATEEAYAELIASPDVQRKAGLIEAKGHDYINMAQKLERVLGRDVVLKAVQHQEYHELLKIVVQHSSIIDQSLTSIADVLRIEIPERLLLGGEKLPVVTGLQLGTKSAIYILNLIENNLRAWAQAAQAADIIASKYRMEEAAASKIAAERLRVINEKQAEINEARTKHEKATSKVLGFAIMNDEGDYLCIDNEDKPFALSNLAYTTDWQEAIIMGTRSKAQDLAARASDKFDVDMMVTPIVALGSY